MKNFKKIFLDFDFLPFRFLESSLHLEKVKTNNKESLKIKDSLSLKTLYNESISYPEFSKKAIESLIDYDVFIKTKNKFVDLLKNRMGNEGLWHENSIPDWSKNYQLFVQKIIVPNSSQIFMWGDLHGSYHSILRTMKFLKENGIISDDLKIKNKNQYFVFLGDYVDRGMFGVELLYLLMNFKLKNPNNVFFTRGNHDDIEFNKTFRIKGPRTFAEQLKLKFLDKKNVDKKIYSIFRYFPSAIYVGSEENDSTNFIQCSHGSFEIGYNPLKFLKSDNIFHYIQSVNRKNFIESISDNKIKNELKTKLAIAHRENFEPKSVITDLKNRRIRSLIPEINDLKPIEIEKILTKRYIYGQAVGFLWHEFIVNCGKKVIDIRSDAKLDREILYGKKLTEYLMNVYSNYNIKFRQIYRAHQHHDSMLKKLIRHKGLYLMWDNTVATLFSGPANFRGEKTFPFDSFINLQMADFYDKWKITHYYKPKDEDWKLEDFKVVQSS